MSAWLVYSLHEWLVLLGWYCRYGCRSKALWTRMPHRGHPCYCMCTCWCRLYEVSIVWTLLPNLLLQTARLCRHACLHPAGIAAINMPWEQFLQFVCQYLQARSKPVQPPTKPVNAPFFLPTIAGLHSEPLFDPSAADTEDGGEADKPSNSSRINRSRGRSFCYDSTSFLLGSLPRAATQDAYMLRELIKASAQTCVLYQPPLCNAYML